MIGLRPDARTLHHDQGPHMDVCRKCGCPLFVLPDDRRGGICFDCTDLSEPANEISGFSSKLSVVSQSIIMHM